jgi:glutathione S-transferase
MIKVYGRANSINVRKVLWVLDEVGAPYDREDWGRGYRPTSDPVFQAINPFGVVPVIDDGEFRLRESNAIVRYLADKHGRADLYPKELTARATVESWMDLAATDLANGMRPVFHGLVVKNPAFVPHVQDGTKEWAVQMRRLDDHLAANGPYVTGNAFTIGDIPVGLVVNRWFTIPFDKPELKAVAAYYDLLAERPPYKTHGRNGMP